MGPTQSSSRVLSAREMVRAACLALLLLGLAGCAPERHAAFTPEPFDYGDRAPLRLAVERVDVVSAYRPRGAPPAVEHTFATTPEAALRELLEQRLRAVGGSGTIQAVILDAQVVSQPLESSSGLAGRLSTQAGERYTGRLRVRADRRDATGAVVSSVSTTVSRSRNLPADAGFAERQRIGWELTRDLVDDLDAGLMASLEESFAGALRP
jgi:hypothetical protein